jgi:hypothetical protein
VNGRSHPPIVNRAVFAELVAKHDREFPDHGEACACENGLISTLRTFFGPAVLVQNAVAPYVPPDSQPASPRNKVDPRKPWLKRRPGETKAQYDYRIHHSCYNCGTFIVDTQALNLHEDECSQQGRRGALSEEEPE